MINIKQVDHLDNKPEPVTYQHLSNGDFFVFKDVPKELKVRMSPTSFYSFDSLCSVPQTDGEEEVIPVDAEIRWAHCQARR